MSRSAGKAAALVSHSVCLVFGVFVCVSPEGISAQRESSTAGRAAVRAVPSAQLSSPRGCRRAQAAFEMALEIAESRRKLLRPKNPGEPSIAEN